MKNKKISLRGGLLLTALFALWTVLVCTVDVRAAGESGTAVGFAALNVSFHSRTGVHMTLYTVTDWLGLVPVAVCLLVAGVGTVQLLRRKSLRNVDGDILLLGAYYAVVIGCYLVFEMCPVNYRPILIGGAAEASYPSSTTLLVLCVMPTLVLQTNRRVQNPALKRSVRIVSALFSLFMVIGRLVAGVHWLTDIVGSVLLSAGLFFTYKSFCEKGGPWWNSTKNFRN